MAIPNKYTFTFTWKIENISLYTEKIDTDLLSPSFKIGTTKPTEFQIYLKSGDWSTKNICLRVLESPLNLNYQYYRAELALLRADGEVIESYYEYVLLWTGEVHDLCPQPTLFSNEKVLLLLLQQNTLIIRWKVFSVEYGECFFRTVFQQKIFRWHLRGFSKSPTFTTLFKLSSLHITVDLSKLQYNIIIAKFIPSNQDKLHFGNCAIIAVDNKEDTVHRFGKVHVLCYKKVTHQFCDASVTMLNDQHWEAPVMLDEVVCNLIENDTLTLEWEFTVGIGEFWDLEYNALDHQVSPSTLRTDLLRLYEDRKFCDATLTCNFASFPVHKSVLCARSPVFFAKFDIATKEDRTDIVHIPDIEPDTLARMLHFLYTDSLEDISWETAAGLYYAADKYRIQALKDKCVRILKGKLSVTNACDALVFANTHQDEDLMQAVKDFVFDHDEVVRSDQWKELKKENSPLAYQLLSEMYLKKNK